MADMGLNFDFSGRKVLITGGSSGIGKATAKTFLKLGASVIVVGRTQEGLDALKSEHPEITTISADVTDWNGLEVALAPHHPIHHLVNNVGTVGGDTSLFGVTEEAFDNIININFKSGVRCAQLVSRGMIDAKLEGATIVNISSCESGRGRVNPQVMVYCASKAAVLAATRSIAHALAPHKIRVNSIRPATVETELVQKLNPTFIHEILGPLIDRQVYHKDLMKPQHIANAIVYLSSPASEMVTGIDLTVDAGYELS